MGVRASKVGAERPIMTARLWDELIDRYLCGVPASHLAAWCGASVGHMRVLLSAAVDQLLEVPRPVDVWRDVTHIAIDEVFWAGRILVTVLDLTTGHLLDVLPDRQPDTVTSFLKEMNALRGNIPAPVFVTDMWLEYRTVLRAVYGPDVQQVADRFHIQGKLSEDLVDVGRLILPPTAQRPRQLRSLHRRFLAALQGSPASAPEIEQTTRKQRDLLEAAVDLTVAAREIWRSGTVSEANHWLSEWRWQRAVFEYRLSSQDISGQPFGRVEYLLNDWQREVLAYCDPVLKLPDGRNPSSGRLEAVNGVIRTLLLRSHHARRLPFSSSVDLSFEQKQFNRLWLRLVHRVNRTAQTPAFEEEVHLPAIPDCPCGVPYTGLLVKWSGSAVVWDRPLGPVPVRLSYPRAQIGCPACGHQSTVGPVGQVLPVTPFLRDDLLEWRREGYSLRALHRMTGVSVRQLKRLVRNALPEPVIYHPPLVGILRWRWRRRECWVITDPRTGKLLDLLPSAQESDWEANAKILQQWLERANGQGTYQVSVGSLEWAMLLSDGTSPLGAMDVHADRFTVISLVHVALREVVWRFMNALSVTQQRGPQLRRARFLLLARPGGYRRLDDRLDLTALHARRDVLLASDLRLATATNLLRDLRQITRMDANDDILGALHDWTSDAERRVALPARPEPLDRSLHFAFTRAIHQIRHHQEAIEAGLTLQAAEGISLAASRRLLRSLNEFQAAQQPDFDFLRRSALHVFGHPE
jgi:Holliday junction resolvase-like predicted endonuclease